MADMSRVLAGAGANDFARLQELLDGLLAGQPVQRLAPPPSALEDLPDPDGRWLPEARAVSTTGLVAFSAANALLLQEQRATAPSTNAEALLDGSAIVQATQPHAAAAAASVHVDVRPLASEADWAAAGAEDHALLATLGEGGALPLSDGLQAVGGVEGAAADDRGAALDQVIARLDAQIEALSHDASALDHPITPAETAAVADGLGELPLAGLVTGVREAAGGLQDVLEGAVVGLPADDGLPLILDGLPDLSTAVEVVDDVVAAVAEVVASTGELLDTVGVVVDGVVTPVAEVVADVLQDAGQAVVDVLHDVLADPSAGLPDGLSDLVGAVLDPVADVLPPALVDAIDASSLPAAVGATLESVVHAMDPAPLPAADVLGDALGSVLGEVPSLGAEGGAGADGVLHALSQVLKPGG